ncbi:uncharacterized protein LOC128921486 isoform X1 [Zeugodacus cucurbitae]|uniref:uncharacterized protein LOC128921486 isoform X1 n=1 Tax=Zeugodacus cucurbitae TaxID=28588 RepID=UPI0023D935C4|nr:uncharacterized protein LOC128921486 isoform X1 [Zeugodacus cucurbitae]
MLQDNKLLRDQLRICMEAVVDMKVVVNKWNRHIAEETVLTAKFPLSSVEDVENAEINNDNRECYVKTMKSLLRSSGVVKNLKEILTDAVVQEYNIDGIHGKKSLRGLENFYSLNRYVNTVYFFQDIITVYVMFVIALNYILIYV